MNVKQKAGMLRKLPWLHLAERRTLSKPLIDLCNASAGEIAKATNIKLSLAEKIKAINEQRPFFDTDDLIKRVKGTSGMRQKISQTLAFSAPEQVLIKQVIIAGERLFSDKPYAFEIDFVPPSGGVATLASIAVKWKGQTFEVQQLINAEENHGGSMLLKTDKEHALPPGPVELTINIYDSLGGAAEYLLDTWVFPSNPFSLFLSPSNRSIFNGSVRPDWDGTNWHTGFNFTLLNGDNTTVRLQRDMVWKFWDGGVGGTLVDSGTWNWAESLSIGPFENLGGWFSVTAPPGNNIFRKYEDREDLTFELIFRKVDGTPVTATITCRIMGGWGLNIILVGDFSDAERDGIQNGISDARDVYENHGLTFSSVNWWGISNADAGGYTILNSTDEWNDLLDDWTVNNDSVDCFVVRGFWDSVAGYSPVPGPDGKNGSCQSDGLAVSNGMDCLAHELGHYMGGHNHADGLGRGNVMHSICGGRQFTYEQYKKFLRHNWTRIVR